MALTSLDIQQKSFGASRHGYDPQEVDVFLEQIAAEVDEFNRVLHEANTRCQAAEARALTAEQQAVQLSTREPGPQDTTEEQIARAFIAAQRSADLLKEEARAEAEKIYREAEQRARDVVRDATTEKQRILAEIETLRESCEKFRSEYLSLLNHFSADAKKLMPTIDEASAKKKKDTTKTAADDSVDFIAENDAANVPSKAVSKPAAKTPVSEPEAPIDDEKEGATIPEAPEEMKTTQEVIDLDDDLDIEEID